MKSVTLRSCALKRSRCGILARRGPLSAEALGFMFADILFRSGQYIEDAILPDAGLGHEASGIVEPLVGA